jgi:hypothetical protein
MMSKMNFLFAILIVTLFFLFLHLQLKIYFHNKVTLEENKLDVEQNIDPQIQENIQKKTAENFLLQSLLAQFSNLANIF